MFGADVTFSTFVQSLQESFTESKNKIDSTASKIVMYDKYLTDFGITTPQELEKRPLGVVAMYDAEDPLFGCLWEDRAIEFADLDIGSLFHLSFLEYLELPRHRIESLNRAAIRIKQRRNKDQSTEYAKLEKLLRDNGIDPNTKLSAADMLALKRNAPQ